MAMQWNRLYGFMEYPSLEIFITYLENTQSSLI